MIIFEPSGFLDSIYNIWLLLRTSLYIYLNHFYWKNEGNTYFIYNTAEVYRYEY